MSLLYMLAGGLWILFSDKAVKALIQDPELLSTVQAYQGWVFVALSGSCIYLLVNMHNTVLNEAFNKLKKSRDEFRTTFEYAPMGIARYTPNEELEQVNRTFCNMLGYSKEELTKLRLKDFIHPEDLKDARDLDELLMEGKQSFYRVEKRCRRKDGTYFTGMLSKSVVFDHERKPSHMVIMLEDISEKKETESALKKSLNEKNILLAEVHHRVRNNLALISALFELQTLFAENQKVKTILNDSQMRVKCLALIHESYTAEEHSAHIDFGKYLNELISFINHTFKDEIGRLEMKKQVAPVNLNINQAVPAGLLCNEILLEVFVRSLTDSNNPEIGINLEEDEREVQIEVKFSGGMKEMYLKPEHSDTFGALIIKTLCSQLQGVLNVTKNKNMNLIQLQFQKSNQRGPSSTFT
ncbi:PAS domain S-box-containing protein [Gracilimonas mengyeensis]|uniref:histidine kinase n=2 Tax=Gracilimonas mengyeensis TaxID=1302730 RepID=A0A521CB20_9BACT|nr:PAS domain S-box-containing protein [Gracilimonas mengyeensis]